MADLVNLIMSSVLHLKASGNPQVECHCKRPNHDITISEMKRLISLQLSVSVSLKDNN